MPYSIVLSNGEPLVTLADGVSDNSYTSLNLVGKNFAGYGQLMNENFVHLLENFCSSVPPFNPLVGQIWYDTYNHVMKVFSIDGVWKSVGNSTSSSASPPLPLIGEQWWDTVNSQLYVWSGKEWILLGPRWNSSQGKTTVEALTAIDSDGSAHSLLVFYINNAIVGVWNNDPEFMLAPGSTIPNFPLTLPHGFSFDVLNVGDINASGNQIIDGTLLVFGDITGNLIGDTTGTHVGPSVGSLVGDTTGTHFGDVYGNIVGDTTGIHFGDSYGDVVGDTTGSHFGDSYGNVVGNTTGTHFGDVVGNVLGNTTGIHFGDSYGNVVGNTTGVHYGDVFGNVIGNTTGTHYGDVRGGTFYGTVISPNGGSLSGSLTGNVRGDLIGNVTGDLTGSVYAQNGRIYLADGSVPNPSLTFYNHRGVGLCYTDAMYAIVDGIACAKFSNTGLGVGGSLTAQGDIIAFSTSDRKFKTNIQPIENALSKLKNITGVMFDWTDEALEKMGGEDGNLIRKKDTGVIAQDVELVLPEVVGQRPDGSKAVRYEKLAGLIIQAINELAEEVEQLKNNKS